MNFKCLALASVLMIAAPSFAKGLSVGKAEKLDAAQGAFHPVLSADGSKLLYTSEDYYGLQLMDMASGESETVSDKLGAGDSPFFSDGNSQVCYKSIDFKDRLQYREVKAYDMASKASSVVVAPTRETIAVAKSANGSTVMASGVAKTAAADIYAYVSDDVIVVSKNGKSIEVDPIDDAQCYLWVSVSPSGDRLLFVEPYGGVYTSDLNGDNLVSYGQGVFPTWYGDNYIIMAKTKDDGHILLESRLYIVNAKTKAMVALTAADAKANEATGSIEAGVVVYATDLGELFTIDVKVNE